MNFPASPQGSLLHLGSFFSTSSTACFPSLLLGAPRESRQQWTEVGATATDCLRIALRRRGNLGGRRPPTLAGRVVGEAENDNDPSPSGSGPVTTTINQPKTPPRKESGVGFGAASSTTKTKSLKASKDKGSKEKTKAAVIRRASPQTPVATSTQDPQTQQIEAAFIASWAVLGLLILVEGVVLAASGFLPEDWDDFLVKVLYPSFSPTVGLFLIGAASYGVYKYLGGGNKTN